MPVPAYASVLVPFDPLAIDGDEVEAIVARLIAELPAALAQDDDARLVEMPVRYGGDDGPDLEDVAALNGLRPADVIELHAGVEYEVFFLGFAPGFAYLGTLPEAIATPRLASPRVRVPAGSVGIAGAQTGVYPFALPGGWRMIGRTDVGDVGRRSPIPCPAPTGRSRSLRAGRIAVSLEVIEPGLLTTVQDAGRTGWTQLGVPIGGACDAWSLAVANLLVGNDAGRGGARDDARRPDVRRPRTDDDRPGRRGSRRGRRARPGAASRRAGATGSRPAQTIAFPAPTDGAPRLPRAAAAGSTSRRCWARVRRSSPPGFGGLDGRPIRAGDRMRRSRAPMAAGLRTASAGRCRTTPFSGPVDRRSRSASWPAHRGPQPRTSSPRSGESARRAIATGIRLEGPAVEALQAHAAGELLSHGVVHGAIQVPPGGAPIVLLADHQTTGGYPIAAVVISADHPRLGQLRPGTTVRFREVTLAEARAALAAQRAALVRGAGVLRDDAGRGRSLAVGRRVGSAGDPPPLRRHGSARRPDDPRPDRLGGRGGRALGRLRSERLRQDDARPRGEHLPLADDRVRRGPRRDDRPGRRAGAPAAGRLRGRRSRGGDRSEPDAPSTSS